MGRHDTDLKRVLTSSNVSAQDTFRQAGIGLWGAPIAWLFGLAVAARRFAYDRGLMKIEQPGLFTVSVGGLEAGGSGKTPVTGWLLERLVAAGERPALLSRGYGRVSRGLVLRAPGELADPAQVGDEPAMLVASGLDVPLGICARRIDAARAVRACAPTLLVLDDAFSHRVMARDLDVVVLRGEAPLGAGRLLPAGTLREPPSSLRRAHVVWRHFRGRPQSEALPELPAALRRYAVHALQVTSVDGPLRLEERAPATRTGATPSRVVAAPAGRRVVAACGIARPRPFLERLRAAGLELAAVHVFADHEAYGSSHVDVLSRSLERAGADALVVTAKDAVKLAPIWRGPAPLWVASGELLVCEGEAQLLARLRATR